MRTKLLYACLSIGLLVGVAAGAALAQDEDEGAPDQTARQERIEKLREARNESLRMFREDRADAIADYRAAFNATKASFLENKTRVLDECGASADDNESESGDEANQTATHCVRDGLKPLIQKARTEHKAQKDELLARLLQAREDAKAHFLAARQSFGPRAG